MGREGAPDIGVGLNPKSIFLTVEEVGWKSGDQNGGEVWYEGLMMEEGNSGRVVKGTCAPAKENKHD